MIHKVKAPSADLSDVAQRVDETFEELCAGYSGAENDNADSYQVLDSARVRYRLWAGNLGAFLNSNSKASLKHRVRNIPALEARFLELLEDLLQELNDCMSSIYASCYVLNIELITTRSTWSSR